jgi:hypothetical protein
MSASISCANSYDLRIAEGVSTALIMKSATTTRLIPARRMALVRERANRCRTVTVLGNPRNS